MLDARLYKNGAVTSLPVVEISDRVDSPGCLLWIDALDPDPAELHELAEEFSLHPLALEGALQRGERPKLERYPTHRFIVAYTAALARVALFIGSNWVVSVHFAQGEEAAEGHQRAPWDPSVARERFEALDSKHDVGRLIYSIIDELVDGYETRTDELSDCVEAIEDRVLEADDDTSIGVEKDVLAVRRDLVKFRRVVVPLRDVVQDVLRSRRPEDNEAMIALNDVHDHILRVVDQLDALRELLGNAFDAHLAGVSNQMNLVMKKLTAWGSIVFGATLIAGIYGMNFKHMPELDWWFGYPMALGLMLLLSVVLYSLFKRKKWL